MKKDFTKLYCFVDDFIKDFKLHNAAIVSSESKTNVASYFSIAYSTNLTTEISFNA
jgi:hypothetical protein